MHANSLALHARYRGNVGPWTGFLAVVYTGNADWGGLSAPEGSYYAVLQMNSAIEQTLATRVGQHYAVSFQAAPRPRCVIFFHLFSLIQAFVRAFTQPILHSFRPAHPFSIHDNKSLVSVKKMQC
jgi:hypothetical protein